MILIHWQGGGGGGWGGGGVGVGHPSPLLANQTFTPTKTKQNEEICENENFASFNFFTEHTNAHKFWV